ncbi:MAG: septum formation initiator family protein [Candidatus Woykebacteria bacterium]
MKTFLRFLVITLLLVIIVALSRSVYDQASKFQKIHEAEGKAKVLEKQNEELKETLENERGSFSLERQARDKLGYQKPGEVLYVVPQSQKAEEKEKSEDLENWEKWFNLLFN